MSSREHRLEAVDVGPAGMEQQPEVMQLLFQCLSTLFKHLVGHLVSMLPEVEPGPCRPRPCQPRRCLLTT